MTLTRKILVLHSRLVIHAFQFADSPGKPKALSRDSWLLTGKRNLSEHRRREVKSRARQPTASAKRLWHLD